MKPPIRCTLVLLILTMLVSATLQAQPTNIYTKEGTLLYRRTDLIVGFIKQSGNQQLPLETKAAVSICTVDLMNRHFTNAQIKRHTDMGQIDIMGLTKEDSSIMKSVHDCWAGSTHEKWLAFQKEYVADCKKIFEEKTKKPLDSAMLESFCRCQLNLMVTTDVPFVKLEKIDDPSLPLFNQVVKQCGTPFKRNWVER